MKHLLISLALVLGFSTVAHANIMIEPYLGYDIGKTTDPDGKTSGTVIGGRLAYKAPVMFWIGVDGAFETGGKFKPDSGSDADMTRTTFYGVAGIDLPIFFRVWAGYGLSDEFKFDSPYNTKSTGSNYKLGVAFTGLPFVSLNVEYIKAKTTGGSVHDANPDFQHETVLLSVSLPLVF